jgi:hypothetical protein
MVSRIQPDKEHQSVALRSRLLLAAAAVLPLTLAAGGSGGTGNAAIPLTAAPASSGGGIPAGPAPGRQAPAMLNIPLAVSAQQVNYNVPGLRPATHLRLNGKVLAEMYQGTMTALVIGPGAGGSTAGFARVEADLSRAINADHAVFHASATAGRDAFGGLDVVIIAAAVLMAAGCAWGLSRRLAECR